MTRPSVVIVGGGIAGLAAGVAFDRAGWSVDVLEQAPAITPIGAALSVWANAIEALETLGLAQPILAGAQPIQVMEVADAAGRPIIGPRVPRTPARLVKRTLLQQVLRDRLGAARLTTGAVVADIGQDATAAHVTLADGSRRSADLVVAADGIWSPAAPALIGNAPTYRGYCGTLAISAALDDDASAGRASEYWGVHERFGVFDAGGGQRYWFHMESAPAGAPPRDHAAILARAAGWPASVGRAIQATDPAALIPYAVHARAAPRRLGAGRIICVGDAAHAMEPNLGQGACQAIEDAAVLGRLGRDLPPTAILPAFERQRLKRIAAVVRGSAEGRAGAHGAAPMRTIVRAALRTVPAAVLNRSIDRMHRLPG